MLEDGGVKADGVQVDAVAGLGADPPGEDDPPPVIVRGNGASEDVPQVADAAAQGLPGPVVGFAAVEAALERACQDGVPAGSQQLAQELGGLRRDESGFPADGESQFAEYGDIDDIVAGDAPGASHGRLPGPPW
jgi:hypothetical protein